MFPYNLAVWQYSIFNYFWSHITGIMMEVLIWLIQYNRTAERDADLIRPLPVLQKTMNYLLSLLDHTYDDSFLGLYNFLWDRMRAIRMDLRMQHFFNQEAISMLEQMVLSYASLCCPVLISSYSMYLFLWAPVFPGVFHLGICLFFLSR